MQSYCSPLEYLMSSYGFCLVSLVCLSEVAYNEESIMGEIMNHGPVEAGFMVYEDFPHYKSGVYRHVQGNMVGGHAIKVRHKQGDTNGSDRNDRASYVV
jgi:hypothetical protein